MKVLIVGVKGVGIECAKNTTLAGVHTMGLYDPGLTELRDLGSNFFLTPDDVGKPRAQVCSIPLTCAACSQTHVHRGSAQVCVPKVTELNNSVRVKEVTELTEAVVAEYLFQPTHLCILHRNSLQL